MKKTSNIVIKLLFLVTLLLPWTVFSTEPVKAQSEKTIEIPFRLQCGNNQTIPVDTSAKVWLVFKSPIKDYEYIKEIPVSGGSAGGNMNYTFNPNEFFKGRLRYIDQPATGAFHLQASAIKDKDGEIHANNFSVQAVSVKYDWNQRTGKYEYTYLNNFNEEVIFNYPKCPVLAAPAAPVSESSDVQVDIGVNYLLQCQTSNSGFEIAPDQALATLKVTIGDQEYSMFELDGKNKKGLNQFAFNFKTEPNSKGWRGVWLGASALISADGKEVINPDTKQIQLGSIRVKDGNYSPLVPGKQAEFSYPRCPSSATSGTSQTTKGGVTVNKYMEEYKLNVSKPACEGTDTEISPRLPISAKQSYKDECKTKTNTCLDGWNNVINSNSDIFTLKGMKDFADNCLKTGVYSISNRITGEEVAASLSERCKDSFPPDKESNKNGECNSLAKSCIDRYVNSTLGSIWDKESLNKICLEVIKPKNNEQKPSDEDIKKEKDKSIDSCNRKELATDSQKISCKARVDVCFNENKKLTLDEIKKKCEEQGRQEGLTFEQKELDGWYTDQKRQQVGQICDKENLTDKQKTDCATATGQCFETKRSDYLSREPNVAGRLSKFAAIEKECISVGQKAISGADADGGGGSGGGGGGGGGGQPGGQQPGAQTAQTKKDPVKTEIVAHIHGQSSGTV
ncbi:hypothetical protein HYU95_05010, partial [Candidatus Daviesbacteria bacterium]|nr:hypothetical protein [Candidatus Daviesbacteria bacterium]